MQFLNYFLLRGLTLTEYKLRESSQFLCSLQSSHIYQLRLLNCSGKIFFWKNTIIFIRLKVLLRRFSFYRELESHGTSSKVVLKARKFIKHILAKNLLNFGFHHFKHMEFFIQDTDITRPRRPKVCLVYCLTSFEINIHG